MCDICDYDFGHIDGCPLDIDEGSVGSLRCSLCGEIISHGQSYIYNPDGDGDGIVCDECIENFSISEILDICGFSSVTEAISEFSGKVMRSGDRY